MTGRRAESKARTRAAIIDAGLRLMHAQGYEATSTTAIARAAGVSPATLFNYFPTKASIVFADADLWTPDAELLAPRATMRATLVAMMRATLDQPGWTLPADHPLTAARFELVHREPALRDAQLAQAFATVPAWAALARQAHPTASETEALAEAGAVVGAALAALVWAADGDIRAAVESALATLERATPA